MTARLPLTLVAGPVSCVCADCQTPDSSGTRAPGSLSVQIFGYRRELGRWLCSPCSRAVWQAYLHAASERRALIHLSWRLGYAATRAHLARERAAGIQLQLLEHTWTS